MIKDQAPTQDIQGLAGNGSLRNPCPAHPESVELAGVAAKLTFINGRPAMCGCQVEYSSGGGEYSDVIYVTLCAKHSGSAILDLVATNRIALTPEYEGQWHADLYLDREIPLAKAEGATPAEAVLALMSAERIDPEQESVEKAGGDERAAFEEIMMNNGRDISTADGEYLDPLVERDWQARAALAQPSPKCATCGDTGQIVVSGPHYCGQFQPPEYETEPCDMCAQPSPAQVECIDCHGSGFCMSISNEEIRCPCRAPIKFSDLAQAEQAEAERPEMSSERAAYFMRRFKAEEKMLGPNEQAAVDYVLSLIAQHERIVGALRFERQQMDRAFTACINERDAALANVDALAVQVLKLGGTISFAHHRTDQAGQVPQAWLDVQVERRRQVEAEGWTPEHDDEHSHGQMARAAACYALAGSSAPNDGTAALLVSLAWPWDEQWWKPSTARRDMVKACALGLAEIERLDRVAASQGGPSDA
ncbi:hypothetical protein FA265_20160 [Pseudomonas aeruginosa]|nr:hypothetical protein [Pseudomonas aeruginosa]MCO2308632.1 hypothetical protein [Pseudomonas aeruginosa]MCO2900841.1 hypothetical protein [Pseudomonas aeruginosa]